MEAAFRLRAVPTSASIARHETRVFTASLPVCADDALVVVTELVANALQHGADPIGLRLAWDGQTLTIEVSDCDPCVEAVTLKSASSSDGHGRGLALTDRLAGNWGTRAAPHGFGKTVWAAIPKSAQSL